MKVFGCTYQGPWGGGIILVAANNADEAFSVGANNFNTSVYFKVYEENNNKVIQSYAFPREDWKEFKNLISTVQKPKVILIEVYTE